MNGSKQHIVILCSRLDLPGGIERAIVNLANLLTQKGRKISLLILDETTDSFYPINSSVSVYRLPLSFGINENGNLLSRKLEFIQNLRSLKEKLTKLEADIVLATEYPFAIAAVLCRYKQAKVLSWEHHHYFELKQSLFWRKLYQFCYPKLRAIVCLNEDEKRLFTRLNKNVCVIPNFIPAQSQKDFLPVERRKRILTVARLTDVKGIDNLLLVVKLVLKRFPQWQWKLIGDGEKKPEIVRFIKQNALESQLLLQHPASHFIENEYKEASLYVMTSKNECFPMTLLEAMQNGLPCLAFDCETGPRAIIQQEQNGLLVEPGNLEAMGKAIASLLTNNSRLEKMSRGAIESMEKFSDVRVYALWDFLFTTL